MRAVIAGMILVISGLTMLTVALGAPVGVIVGAVAVGAGYGAGRVVAYLNNTDDDDDHKWGPAYFYDNMG